MNGFWNALPRMRKANLDELRTLQAKRIAIIKPSALGDIVHALPVLTALRKRFPATPFSWVVNRGYVPLLQNHPDLHEVIPFDRQELDHGFHTAWQTFGRSFRDLRSRRFDVAIDLQGLLRTGLLTYATGAKVRIGLQGAREGASLFYTHQVPADVRETHAVDRYWRVAEAFGVEGSPQETRLPVDADALAWAESFLANYPRPWIVIGVGARWTTKRWPPQHFAALTNDAIQRFGGAAILVGSKDEAPLAVQAKRLISGVSHNVAGSTSLAQLIALLSLADVVIANDTGPLHVAVGFGRPVVTPFLCTQKKRTGPYGQNHRAIESSVWCQGSLVRKCDRLECMDELTPDRLKPALWEILESWATQHRSA